MIDPRCTGESMQSRFIRATETAEQMGVKISLTVAMHRLGLCGGYYHGMRRIALSPNMDCLGEMVFTLWHELGHAALGHDGAQPLEQELRATAWAALHFFTAEERERIVSGGETVAQLGRAFMIRDDQIRRTQAALTAATPV